MARTITPTNYNPALDRAWVEDQVPEFLKLEERTFDKESIMTGAVVRINRNNRTITAFRMSTFIKYLSLEAPGRDDRVITEMVVWQALHNVGAERFRLRIRKDTIQVWGVWV